MDNVTLRPANRPVDQVFPSQWLRVVDVKKPLTLTIKQVGETDLFNPSTRKKETTIVLVFKEQQAMLPCSGGRARAIAKALKEDIPSKWAGKRITISTVMGQNGQPGFKIEAAGLEPAPRTEPVPAENSGKTEPPKPQPTPAENSAKVEPAKPANGGNGHSLPARPWDPESLKKALTLSAAKKANEGIINDNSAKIIAAKMADALAGPAKEGQDAGERKAEIETAKNAYHKVLAWLFPDATDQDGRISANNLTQAEGTTLLGWLLANSREGFKSAFSDTAVTELQAVRVMIEGPVKGPDDEIPF